MHHAATRPAMAPLAPRDVMVSLFRSTCAVSEVMDPKTPEARYTPRKLPRPISSWTSSLGQSVGTGWLCTREELTPQSDQPEDDGVRGKMS